MKEAHTGMIWVGIQNHRGASHRASSVAEEYATADRGLPRGSLSLGVGDRDTRNTDQHYQKQQSVH